MADSLLPGFTVSGDTDGRWPLVLASPHSGRHYPAGFLAAARLPLAQLRRAEDAYVDELLDGIAQVPVMRARHGRAFLDLNRAADELDPAMFDGTLTIPSRLTERVAAGLGVLPRVAAQGLDIYGRRLAPEEAAARIAALHGPWHHRLGELLFRARARHGFAVLVDCHSMPAPAGLRPPQIVLGDRHGQSAAPALVAIIERHFRSFGWRVSRNTPYAGGHTTETHGNVSAGIHAVQIEIDRALYMDGQKLSRHAGFSQVARAMSGLVELLVVTLPALRLGTGWRDAAE